MTAPARAILKASMPERAHDFLYDPIYHVSSQRDHNRVTFKSHTTTDRVRKVHVFPTMFSDLRHYPRYAMKLDITDPVPKFIDRQWRGYAEQQREAIIRYKQFNYDPSMKVPSKVYGTSDVGGHERYKYFRRPIMPFSQVQARTDIVLAETQHDHLPSQASGDKLAVLDDAAAAPKIGQVLKMRPETPPKQDAEVQTDYRESETQTDPYTPEYVIRPGSAPEVLTLASLTWGNGLPVGMAEIEMIERARAKREWEATLPALHDTERLELRQQMMEEQELKEWALREEEIQEMQTKRLALLKELLKEREQQQKDLEIQKLDRLWTKRQEKNLERVKKIRKEYIKGLRKIRERRKLAEIRWERRDMVHEYCDYDSQTYAPLTRIGVFPDNCADSFVVRSRILKDYHALMDFEKRIPAFVTEPRIKQPERPKQRIGTYVRRAFKHGKILDLVHDTIQFDKIPKIVVEKPLNFLTRVRPPSPRPATPAVQFPDVRAEDEDVALIFLQKLMRGRSLQNKMFEGKVRRGELIKELRTTHALKEFQMDAIRKDKNATLALQRQRHLHEHRELVVDEGMSENEGDALSRLFNFFTKELVRLQQERRLHALAMLAERQRRVREAEEAGKRQREMRRRRELDEIFKETIKMTQDTVDSYLEDVILQSIDRTTGINARIEIQEIAKTINDMAYEEDEGRDAISSEEIVANLVQSYLLPAARREMLKQKVHYTQSKNLKCAHGMVFKDTEEVVVFNVPDIRAIKPKIGNKPPATSPHVVLKAAPIPDLAHKYFDSAKSPCDVTKDTPPKLAEKIRGTNLSPDIIRSIDTRSPHGRPFTMQTEPTASAKKALDAGPRDLTPEFLKGSNKKPKPPPQ